MGDLTEQTDPVQLVMYHLEKCWLQDVGWGTPAWKGMPHITSEGYDDQNDNPQIVLTEESAQISPVGVGSNLRQFTWKIALEVWVKGDKELRNKICQKIDQIIEGNRFNVNIQYLGGYGFLEDWNEWQRGRVPGVRQIIRLPTCEVKEFSYYNKEANSNAVFTFEIIDKDDNVKWSLTNQTLAAGVNTKTVNTSVGAGFYACQVRTANANYKLYPAVGYPAFGTMWLLKDDLTTWVPYEKTEEYPLLRTKHAWHLYVKIDEKMYQNPWYISDWINLDELTRFPRLYRSRMHLKIIGYLEGSDGLW
jgi:hypothetical protein